VRLGNDGELPPRWSSSVDLAGARKGTNNAGVSRKAPNCPLRSMKVRSGKFGLSLLLSLFTKPLPSGCHIPQPVAVEIRECDLSQAFALNRVDVAVIC
jgi:hypothetical protein